jgi:hypothetical protein
MLDMVEQTSLGKITNYSNRETDEWNGGNDTTKTTKNIIQDLMEELFRLPYTKEAN